VWSAAEPTLAALRATGLSDDAALTRWGLVLLKQNRAADAAVVFRAALALTPNDPVLWMNCGVAHDQIHLLPDAAACFEKSLALSAAQPDVWLLLGLTRKKQGDFAAAETAFRQTLAGEPEQALAWQCLGLLKEEQRDYRGAIECLTACLRHGGSSPATLANLGKLCYQTGQFPQAHDAFRQAAAGDPSNAHYRQMLRKTRFLHEALLGLPYDGIVHAYRTSFSPAEAMAESELVDLFDTAVGLLGGFGHLKAAVGLGRKRLELWPDSSTIHYILRAMTGEPGLERSPQGFVVEHFDSIAETFDEHLVKDLGYDIPGKIAAAVRAVTPAGRLYDTLDAGCGTGLCGPLLRPLSRALMGVDLSPRMIDQAARRGMYDQLAVGELAMFLQRFSARFDLVVAADVLIYFGDLAPIFAAAAAAMRPGGLFAASTESGPETGYRLRPSGRFAHAPSYVRGLAAECFTEEYYADTTIRMEANQRLPGNIFLFRRR
jgi:predicted TPR repeat methyltransferase